MGQIYRTFGVAVAALVIGLGLIGNALAQGSAPSGGAAQLGPGAGMGQDAAGPNGASRPLEMPILYVTGVEVMRSALNPKVDIIYVTGLVSSLGWSSPQLVPFYYGKSNDEVFDLQFIASSPQQSQKAEGFQTISAMFTLEADHSFKAIRVRASENALTLKQLPGTATATVKVNDCKECVGKKFADKGKAAAGTAGTIREEDLPHGFRTITPTHGVRGITHNPNRINLILDENDVVEMAFWE
jgi:hypothetical protein